VIASQRFVAIEPCKFMSNLVEEAIDDVVTWRLAAEARDGHLCG
jgi:hypothetical protein